MARCPHYLPNIKLLAIFAQQKVRLHTGGDQQLFYTAIMEATPYCTGLIFLVNNIGFVYLRTWYRTWPFLSERSYESTQNYSGMIGFGCRRSINLNRLRSCCRTATILVRKDEARLLHALNRTSPARAPYTV